MVMTAPELLSLKECARRCMGSSVRTVRHWIKTGQLIGRKIPGKNQLGVFDTDLLKFMHSHYKAKDQQKRQY